MSQNKENKLPVREMKLIHVIVGARGIGGTSMPIEQWFRLVKEGKIKPPMIFVPDEPMKKFTPPYRVGRKQQRAVLDVNGHEVVIFPPGLEQHASEYCEFLNSKKIEIKLPEEVIKKVMAELKTQQVRRYGLKMGIDKQVPARSTYSTDHLYNDLEFILNHLHF